MLRMFWLSLLVCFLTLALADKVEITADEFTGAVTCKQTVKTGGNFAVATNEAGELSLTLFSSAPTLAVDLTFSTVGHDPTAQVLVKYGDNDVRSYKPDVAFSSITEGYNAATFLGEASLNILQEIAKAQGNIRVRFEGERGQFDFTLAPTALNEFNTGFLSDCLDIEAAQTALNQQEQMSMFKVSRTLEETANITMRYCPRGKVLSGVGTATVQCNDELVLRMSGFKDEVTVYPAGEDFETFEKILEALTNAP